MSSTIATTTAAIASATPAIAAGDPSIIYISAAVCVALGVMTCAFAQGKVIAQVADSMARQPELTQDLRSTMIIGLAMIESLAIYCLLVSLILLFLKS